MINRFGPVFLLLSREDDAATADAVSVNARVGSVDVRPYYEADLVRVGAMLSFLPVDNAIEVSVKGYRSTQTRAVVSGASLVASLYDSDGTLVDTASLTETTAGNYSGSLDGSDLVAGSRYKVVVSDTTVTKWVRWFYAQDRTMVR